MREQEEQVVWGEEVKVECEVSSAGNPLPSLHLGLENTELTAQLSEDGLVATVSYFPTLQETGQRFLCNWSQVSDEGETLYSGSEASAPLNVVMGPSLLVDTESHLTFHPGLSLRPQFMARPAPAESQVKWYLLTENSTTLQPEEASEAGLVDLVVISELRHMVSSKSEWEWESQVKLFNLTENVTIWFHVENSVGFLDKMFIVELPAATSATSDELQQHNIYDSNSDSLDMTAVSIVGLICLVIFTLLLIIITIIVVRMRNRDGRLKQDKVLEEYRRVPLIPEGANNICCDSGNSSSKSCSCYTRYQGLSMNTFGKNCEKSDTDYIYPRSDTIPSLTSPSSVDTDQLSSLGVRLKEFPDPLADWDDLEPGLQQRRSLHISDSFNVLFRK